MNNVQAAQDKARELIDGEIARQDQMWGTLNEHADISKGQLMYAGMAQIDALAYRQEGDVMAFDIVSPMYPEDWSGFRDYGSDVANLVVAVAFLTQEIRRKIRNGESIERTSRDAAKQPFMAEKPAVLLP